MDMTVQNGIYPLPAGKLATHTVYFERAAPFQASAALLPPALRLERMDATMVERYRALFQAVGRPWLWISRLTMSAPELAALLANELIEAYALSDGTLDIGFLELDRREPPGIEIRYLGLIPLHMNKGWGSVLMGHAFTRAHTLAAPKLWLHSCSFDGPTAFAFYQHHGFKATRHAVEIMDDPRIGGHYPRETAPHIPCIEDRTD